MGRAEINYLTLYKNICLGLYTKLIFRTSFVQIHHPSDLKEQEIHTTHETNLSTLVSDQDRIFCLKYKYDIKQTSDENK